MWLLQNLFHVELLHQEPLARISAIEKLALIALEEDSALAEWPLKMDTFIPVKFRASIINLEIAELDFSTYGWIQLKSN